MLLFLLTELVRADMNGDITDVTDFPQEPTLPPQQAEELNNSIQGTSLNSIQGLSLPSCKMWIISKYGSKYDDDLRNVM